MVSTLGYINFRIAASRAMIENPLFGGWMSNRGLLAIHRPPDRPRLWIDTQRARLPHELQ
jgi:hypothetical protein